MGRHTKIEWASSSWNPWMGCQKVSEGCKNCYMFRDQKRYGHDPAVLRRSKTTFYDPLKWKEPRRIFVCSWSDFFWEEVPDQWRMEAFTIMHSAPQHTFLLLTKRPQNMETMLPEGWTEGMWHQVPNVWLGVSVENQAREERIPILLQTPATVHFVSAEPLLGPLDLRDWLPDPGLRRRTNAQFKAAAALDWVITGGESDPSNPRLMDLDWARNIRDQCQRAGVAYFHKQHGGRFKMGGAWGGRELDGRTWDEFPQGTSR